ALCAPCALNVAWRRRAFAPPLSAFAGAERVLCSKRRFFAERCGEMNTVLTTANVAERKRFQFWQDAVCDTFVELDCQARGSAPFFGEITTTECDDLHFSTVNADGQ